MIEAVLDSVRIKKLEIFSFWNDVTGKPEPETNAVISCALCSGGTHCSASCSGDIPKGYLRENISDNYQK